MTDHQERILKIAERVLADDPTLRGRDIEALDYWCDAQPHEHTYTRKRLARRVIRDAKVGRGYFASDAQ